MVALGLHGHQTVDVSALESALFQVIYNCNHPCCNQCKWYFILLYTHIGLTQLRIVVNISFKVGETDQMIYNWNYKSRRVTNLEG